MQIQYPMKTKLLLISAILVTAGITKVWSQIDYKGFPEWGFNIEGNTQYYLYTPENMDTTEVYPVAIFLHGCCGQDNLARLRNCVDPPVRMWHNFGKNTQKVPTYIIAPATSSGWTQHFNDLVNVIHDLIQNQHGDSTRIYITGFSMGGRGTYDFINNYPGLFAAAIPMGMSFSGSMDRAKDIPFWANVGELDSYGAGLSDQVAAIRLLNGDPRGSDNWVTGVNPRLTIFPGVPHGVQWDAASSQDLVGWALDHVNDGNSYPNVYFANLLWGQYVPAGQPAALEVVAGDNDGSVSKVEILVNENLVATLTASPYNTSVHLAPGDNLLKAVAYDNLGKKSTATILLRVDNQPQITTTRLPEGTQGALYRQKIHVSGNADFTLSVNPDHDPLPEGIELSSDGLLKGIPVVSGEYNVQIDVLDNENDFTYQAYDLVIQPKRSDEVIVTNVNPSYLPVSKLFSGELPSYKNGTEINFSDVSLYGGLTYIPIPFATASSTYESYLSFDIDEDATVYVAYEVLDNLSTSTIPQWLEQNFVKQPGQIVAQYRYYNIYAKDYPKGSITLKGPEASNNGVESGYFVMVKKAGTSGQMPLKLTTDFLHRGYPHMEYNEQLSTTGGQGDLTWKVNSGSLPTGLSLDDEGVLKGYPTIKGDFDFNIKVSDDFGNADSTEYTLKIDSAYVSLLKLDHLDTAFLLNSGTHLIPLHKFMDGPLDTVNYKLTSVGYPESLIDFDQPEYITPDSFNLTVRTINNVFGDTRLFLKVVDKNNPDPLNNAVSAPFTIRVLPFLNTAPECNPIPDTTTGLNVNYVKHEIYLTGINDGNDGSQNISIEMSISNPDVLRSPRFTYTPSNDSALFVFYPRILGSTKVSFLIKDDGGTDLGGVDSLRVEFTIYINETNGTGNLKDDMKFRVFPNPAVDELFINLPEKAGKAKLFLYNLNGKAVLADELDGNGRVNLELCRNGYYIVKIVTAKDTYQTSVVISR